MTWPSLGGGPISLAYLEDEAYAPLPARYRQYGFLKDSEFLDEVPQARRQGLQRHLLDAGLGVPGRAQRGRVRDPRHERAARRRQARLAGPAGVHAEPLPQALGALRAVLPRRPHELTRASASPTSSRSAAPGTSTATPTMPTGSRCPRASTSATSWTSTTRSGASTSRPSCASTSTRAWTASSSTSPTARWLPSTTAAPSATTTSPASREYLRGLPADKVPASVGDRDAFHYGQWLLVARRRDRPAQGRRETRASWLGSTPASCRVAKLPTSRSSSSYVREYAASVGRTVLVSVEPLRRGTLARPARGDGRHPRPGAAPHALRAARLDALHRGLRRRQAGVHLDEPVRRGDAGAAAQAEPRPGHGPLPGHDVRGRGHGRQHVGALRRLDGQRRSRTPSGPPTTRPSRSRTSSPTTRTSSRARRTTRSGSSTAPTATSWSRPTRSSTPGGRTCSRRSARRRRGRSPSSRSSVRSGWPAIRSTSSCSTTVSTARTTPAPKPSGSTNASWFRAAPC